ncbi:hypothetical protein VdG1_09418 [Verticillium dahliae VDG1]|nr:hypothetical protein VdG1_09418 [Verticillium dahliae VDG1]
MGIAMPTEVRGDMAMPGEWTVTNTRVVSASPAEGEAGAKVEAKAVGVRKREATDEQKEEEEAEPVEGQVKTEEGAPHETKTEDPAVKAEPADEGEGGIDPRKESAPAIPDAGVKTEEGAQGGPAPVVFKKRKPKNIRQK